MKTLLLKLSGPLQSWGTNSHFETRMTDIYPSKSGIIGLIAAALGYRRNEDEKIRKLNDLDFAIRIDQPGRLLKDYQTVRSASRNYVTSRYYLEDAVFVVALSSQDQDLIEDIEKAVRHPYFQCSLGRRSAVPIYDMVLGITEEGPIDILKSYEWQASRWYRRTQGETVLVEILADNSLIGSKSLNKRQDRVISFSQESREFGFRYEGRIIVEVQNTEKTSNDTETKEYFTKHNIFALV